VIDNTGDGLTTDDVTPLGGVTINLHAGDSADGEIVATTTTADDGTYTFENVAPGTYFVQEVVPDGYEQTGGGYIVIVGDGGLESGQTSSGNNFANFQTPTAQIDIEKYVKAVTVVGGEGLTTGYWTQPHHVDTWVATGYSPEMSFNTVFGVNDPDYPTLVQALGTGGGGFDALGRHAVAALLNAAHTHVEYAYTVAQVIAAVQGAYANPATVETVKNQPAVWSCSPTSSPTLARWRLPTSSSPTTTRPRATRATTSTPPRSSPVGTTSATSTRTTCSTSARRGCTPPARSL
jgi:hypothetical protein